jgi:hypothetical protein
LTQDIEKADIPGGRGNGQIIQNRQKKTKIDQGDLETVKWPLTGCKVQIFAQNKV